MKALIVTPWLNESGTLRPLLSDAHPECSWSDVTNQSEAHVLAGVMPYTVNAEAPEAVIAAIEADARFAVVRKQDDDAAPVVETDAATLKARLAAMGYHADVLALAVDEPGDTIAALIEAQRRPPHEVGKAVAVGDVVQYQGNLYRCVQAHTTQADWRPNVTPALWVRFHEVEDGPQPWVQPVGAHDAYNAGDKVTYKGNVYESLINANVWSPEAYPAGWKLIP